MGNVVRNTLLKKDFSFSIVREKCIDPNLFAHIAATKYLALTHLLMEVGQGKLQLFIYGIKMMALTQKYLFTE